MGKERGIMFVRLKLEESRDGLVATISDRHADGKIAGPPRIFLVRTKEEAQKASAVAKGFGVDQLPDHGQIADGRPAKTASA
jgi:hypothetical protein